MTRRRRFAPTFPSIASGPTVLAEDARAFMASFPGKTAYAVKTNGERLILETLVEAGVRSFDVASPGEFEAVRAVSPDAELLYMHPVKAQSDIRLALEKFGVRVMALDHEDEVAKILRIVRALDLDPADITLFVRLQTKGSAAYELSRKFGAAPAHAVELLRAARSGRLPRRALLPCRQSDRGRGNLRARACLGRLGAEPRRRAACGPRRRRRLSRLLRARPAQPQTGDAGLGDIDGGTPQGHCRMGLRRHLR